MSEGYYIYIYIYLSHDSLSHRAFTAITPPRYIAIQASYICKLAPYVTTGAGFSVEGMGQDDASERLDLDSNQESLDYRASALPPDQHRHVV